MERGERFELFLRKMIRFAKKLSARSSRLRLLWHGIVTGKGCTYEGGLCADIWSNSHIQIGKNVRFGRNIRLTVHGGTLVIGDNCEICDNVVLHVIGNLHIENNCYIGFCTTLSTNGAINIKHHSLIAAYCMIIDHNHFIERTDILISAQGHTSPLPITVGPDAWLGAGVRVVPGGSIAEGAVIGANAVVTRPIPPGAIAVGIPAKVVRNRKILTPDN